MSQQELGSHKDCGRGLIDIDLDRKISLALASSMSPRTPKPCHLFRIENGADLKLGRTLVLVLIFRKQLWVGDIGDVDDLALHT